MGRKWLLLFAFAGGLGTIGGCAPTQAVAPARTAATELPDRARVLATAARAADWQLANLDDLSYMPSARRSTANPRDWQQATFWVALTELADRSADPRYRDAILATGRRVGWKLGDRLHHADDHLIGQAWLWAAEHGAGAQAIAPMRATFDRMLADPQTGSLEFIAPAEGGDPACTTRWCWCDAIFMAPTTLTALTEETGDKRYADFAHREFDAVTDYLYDRQEKLYYRDSRFITRRDPGGAKLFWSRGNGWVMAGIARIIDNLDASDPRRARYVDLFRDMAGRIVTLQRTDGYWAPSLLGDRESAPIETSGTGFYVYSLAWGVNRGLLDRAAYESAIVRGWNALERAVEPDGRLGWVQQVSDRPDDVKREDAQFYGVGALILAGSEVADMVR
ncbi:glycosyl hydrolase family 88 [Sphingomonas gilva]|uniref:Glycosyl hydrolase family 88 n=1 Tax=Sphingomonas gilva TaxID=2305907 RepID=A0A396RUP0_9SPHN|nr:glycoside hydrolase family 88 protein [Sphingomonas gilva]RHW19102.1 glycosyl hydrolase family 88 [Sphingomonas gilva]